MLAHGMIGPVLALVGWTYVMWFWMYATRIPAMQQAKVD
ncbi:MAG: MAPEG family protein, partial [Candidatus Binatia bacterium]